MTYHNLENIISKRWLANNAERALFNQWARKPNDSKEKLLLSRYDTYIGKIIRSLRSTKKFQNKIRSQFVATYNELEVGCSIIDEGFKVNFEKSLKGKRSILTPDLFIENDNVIVEVKTLHQSAEEEKGMTSHEVFFCDPAKRIRDDLFEELHKYGEQRIKYPLIVVVCPDVINPPLASQDDFETVLYSPFTRMTVRKSLISRSTKLEYEGLYFTEEYGEQTAILSGVGLWRWKKKNMVFYPNPNVKKTSEIRRGNFRDYLRSMEITKL
jgi:hypothetical protein